MNDMLKKVIEKKRELSPVEKKAKLGVVEDMKRQAEGLLGGKIKGLKKVTVASDSPEGLKEGLEKAEEIVESPELLAEGEEEIEEDPLAIPAELSEEEIDAKLQELMALKKQLQEKKA